MFTVTSSKSLTVFLSGSKYLKSKVLPVIKVTRVQATCSLITFLLLSKNVKSSVLPVRVIFRLQNSLLLTLLLLGSKICVLLPETLITGNIS